MRGKQLSEGWLSLQNVHCYTAMSRLYPRLVAIERELEAACRRPLCPSSMLCFVPKRFSFMTFGP